MRQPKTTSFVAVTIAAAFLAHALPAPGQTKQTIEGIRNFTRVGPTIGCGGATSPAAVPELKREGFASIINLRLETEADANVAAEKAAAEAAGLKYIHIPFNLTMENPAGQVEKVLAALTDASNEPIYIHCNSANRVGAMWLIKRVLIDKWDVAKASAEAKTIGLENPALLDFALEYIKTH